jgi:hypothetical protein
MNEWQVLSKAIASPMTELGAFVPAQDRAECPLPGQANPPNKDRHGSKAEIQTETLPDSRLL